MANHKSAEKKIRQIRKKREHNRYYAKTMRNAVTEVRKTTDKKQAEELLSKVEGMIDKVAKKNIIHRNKAANLKSKLRQYVNKL